jgi:hypothetical protein
MLSLRLLAFLFPVLIVLPSNAAMLYKSIGANGTIIFSDVPPPSDARVIDQRRMPDSASAAAAPGRAGMPIYEFPEYDAEIAQANTQVDLAEHALALARQGLWSPRDGLRLVAGRMSQGDEDRVEFYKKGVRVARQQLMDLLRERQSLGQPAQLASR